LLHFYIQFLYPKGAQHQLEQHMERSLRRTDYFIAAGIQCTLQGLLPNLKA
jgi:hypothetical protein